jgi:hypothetical protein
MSLFEKEDDAAEQDIVPLQPSSQCEGHYESPTYLTTEFVV